MRLAAVKAVCTTARQLLVGPASAAAAAAATAAAGPASVAGGALLSPLDALLGSMGSQEEADAAAADLGLDDILGAAAVQQQENTAAAAAAAAAGDGGGAAVGGGGVRDVAFVQEALKRVYLRLRDIKPAVRKATVQQFMTIFRAVVAAGTYVRTYVCVGVPCGSALMLAGWRRRCAMCQRLTGAFRGWCLAGAEA